MSNAVTQKEFAPDSSAGDEAFRSLQERFVRNYDAIFSNDLAEKTVVVIPSLTLDTEILKTIRGVVHYEERMLSLLMLLRMPRTHVIFVSSIPIDNSIIDYYLHLLPGITGYHATQRLTLLSCYDASETSLTEKILARPRLMQRIRDQVRNADMAHMACFNVTPFEKQLAILLDLPIYGCPPDLMHLGSKSGSRKIFKKLGLLLPDGREDLQNEEEIATALAEIKNKNRGLQKAVVKMNDAFSGEGNAIFDYSGLGASEEKLKTRILEEMPRRLTMVAANLGFGQFMEKFRGMGGIVEEFLQGTVKESPSVQCIINPLGNTEILSTHDQLLGGESGQVFLGASFPANIEYRKEIAGIGRIISSEMQQLGIVGRFSVDFLSVKNEKGWNHYALEINLRKGGTTHPLLMLQFLTGGKYNAEEGAYFMPNGQTRCYFASDNVVNERYKGLTPHDLIDIAMYNKLQFDGASQAGVMFHMIGALSQFGKLGMVCIGTTMEEARGFYDKTIKVLDEACA